jgi:hypothetical protein
VRPGANDPELVRREYADESGLSARIAALESATGPLWASRHLVVFVCEP